PPGEVADEIQSDLVEDNTKAQEIAAREVGDRNRRPEYLELVVIGNPLIQAGQTIGVTHEDVGADNAHVFVEHVDQNISSSGYTTTIRTTGGNLSGYDASPVTAAPVASFVLTLYLESIDTGSSIQTVYIGVADGSASFDPDGTIASYAWTITP